MDYSYQQSIFYIFDQGCSQSFTEDLLQAPQVIKTVDLRMIEFNFMVIKVK